ncbi:glycosyltransferase family 2 protein [Plantactinospora sp. CA-294935]|uniref:glycosyltransferase family 2 protein n=1 Tax=Plantactinospora sp. CA-294935 TaxID=3240012 RepID=UPI003D908EDC
MTERGLSVVVPVKGRVQETRALLASLRDAIAYCPEPVQLLLVDDSTPADARLHRAHCTEHGATYVLGPRYVGAKRNLGVRLARYDLVLFIDSDCLATPDLLQRHLKTLRTAPPEVGAVAGPTYLQGADTTVFRVMRRSRLLNAAFEWPGQCRRVAWATTCNLAVRKSAFQSVGGFAERPLTVVGGEDVDLGIRLTEAGWTITCDPAAVVVHDKGSTDSLGTVSRRLVTYGRSGQWLLDVHPKRGRPKLNRTGVLVLAAMAALPGLRHSRGRTALLVPLAAAALLARDTRERLAPTDESLTSVAEAAACALLDWSFDLGEFIGALQLGRPDRIFTGFGWTDDEAFEWDRTPDRPYGG